MLLNYAITSYLVMQVGDEKVLAALKQGAGILWASALAHMLFQISQGGRLTHIVTVIAFITADS